MLYTSGLNLKSGIWHSSSKENISYPEEGNDSCFEIEDKSFWFRHRNRVIGTLIKKYTKDKVFFDVGGGNGYVSYNLQKEKIKTVLVEPGSGAFNAKKRGLENIVQATLDKACFRDASLPSAGLFDVLEHIEDDKSFVSSIHRKLETNGCLYLTVPAYNFLWSDEDVLAEHFRRYSKKSLCKVLEQSGFQVKYFSYFFSILPPAIFLLRSLPYRIGLNNQKKGEGSKTAHQHEVKKGFISKILEKLWEKEISTIEKGKSLPFGGSCVVVAQKRS